MHGINIGWGNNHELLMAESTRSPLSFRSELVTWWSLLLDQPNHRQVWCKFDLRWVAMFTKMRQIMATRGGRFSIFSTWSFSASAITMLSGGFSGHTEVSSFCGAAMVAICSGSKTMRVKRLVAQVPKTWVVEPKWCGPSCAKPKMRSQTVESLKRK